VRVPRMLRHSHDRLTNWLHSAKDERKSSVALIPPMKQKR